MIIAIINDFWRPWSSQRHVINIFGIKLLFQAKNEGFSAMLCLQKYLLITSAIVLIILLLLPIDKSMYKNNITLYYRVAQNSFPLRVKSIHFVNPPKFIGNVVAFFKMFLPAKIKNRVSRMVWCFGQQNNNWKSYT